MECIYEKAKSHVHNNAAVKNGLLHVLYLFTVQTEICKPKRAGCEMHSFIYV